MLPLWAQELASAVARDREDAGAALTGALDFGTRFPLPGRGDTAGRWEVLGGLARIDLTWARVLEAHTDALAILAEADADVSTDGTWGVFAAESPTEKLTAQTGGDGTFVLTGVKPWCSLGHVLDNALVTAHIGVERQLFAVDLRRDDVRAAPPQHWVARGLRAVTSVPVCFDGTPARAVGEPGWYLRRAGFAWGGIGVAACWYGGALGLADTLHQAAASRGGDLSDLHVGIVDAQLHAARCVLDDAARAVDSGTADAADGTLLALRTRQVVADSVERVLKQVAHALGPAPLAFDAVHAARVADLELYVRQHHGERDLAALGETGAVVTFDHAIAGTPALAWDAVVRATAALTVPGAGDRVVVLAAHPDDETLGAGGLIATAAARGAEVTVVVATDGEASHPRSPTHSPDRLREIRRDEVGAAVAELAPGAKVRLLGLPDGDLESCVAALTAALIDLADGATHFVTPWTRDRHPDHEACARVTAAVRPEGTAHWQYPIWVWHWGDPSADDLPAAALRSLPLDAPAVGAKRRALSHYASQHQPLSAAAGDEPILSESLLKHFARPAEIFVVDEPQDTPVAYFESLYAADEDPWGLGGRWYEQRKRALLLAALPRRRFGRAFEPGCATGLLTQQLAGRCDEVVAWDIAESAVTQTAQRVATSDNVVVELGHIPQDWPSGMFELIVVSETGYFCADLDALADRIDESLTDDGVLVACHWRHHAAMNASQTPEVHEALGRRYLAVASHVEEDFLLHVWTRSGLSVATADGLLA